MMKDCRLFSLGSYAADHAVHGVVCLVGLLGLYGMLSVFGLQVQPAVCATLFTALVMMAVFAWDFARKAKAYKAFEDALCASERSCQPVALTEEPAFLEGKIAFSAASVVSSLANQELTQLRQEQSSYHDYIEAWIHEVKTPISAASLIMEGMHGAQEDKLRYELDRIEANVQQALYYARSSSLSNDYLIKRVDLGSVVKQACKDNARLLIAQGVMPQVNIADRVTVYADSSWLLFVLAQLLTNSAKYGATSVTFSVGEEGIGTPEGKTVLEIADDGVGIPSQDVPHVFEHGFTGANGRAEGKATGLGLYLVATLCQKMGIGVMLASEEGVGTRVLLAFPHDDTRFLTTV